MAEEKGNNKVPKCTFKREKRERSANYFHMFSADSI